MNILYGERTGRTLQTMEQKLKTSWTKKRMIKWLITNKIEQFGEEVEIVTIN